MCVISVIIPSYNSGVYLTKCLNSCLEQTFEDFEIIVVDDGSIDETRSLLKAYMLKDKRIRYIYKKNEGLVCARRTGLEHSKGTFIFFIDADDYIERNALQLLYEKSQGCDITIGNILIENTDGKLYPLQHKNVLLYDISFENIVCNYLSKSVIPSLCGRLIRKTLFDKVYVPAEFTIGEDVITNLLILLKVHTVKFKLVDEKLYHYVQYSESMMNMKSEKTLCKRLDFLKWIDVNISVIENTNIRECLAKFISIELYAFLRDGGNFNMNSSYGKLLYDKYVSLNALKRISIWHAALIVSFRYCAPVGKLFRSSLIFIRSIIN